MTQLPNTMNLELKKRIMRRVYFIWFWRGVAPMLAVEFILLTGVAAGVLANISLRHIFLNALQASADIRAFVVFFVDNFFVKSIQSRMLVAVYLVVAAFFGRDIYSAIGRMRGWRKDDWLVALSQAGNQKLSF